MNTLPRFALLASVVGFAVGCGGTETGNPTLPAVELRVSAYSGDFSSVAISKPGPGLTLERIVVALEQVELFPCATSRPPVRFAAHGVELTQEPAFTLRAAGTAEDYCGARVELAPRADTGVPGLDGHSVSVSGHRSDGTPFELTSGLGVSVELHSDPPGTPFSAERVLLAFNFATWLAGVDVAGAPLTGDEILIDETHNADLLAAFEARAALTPALFDDADGDGQLAGDDQPPAAGP